MKRMADNNHLMWRMMTGAGLLAAGLLAGSGCARFAAVSEDQPALKYDDVLTAAAQVRSCSYVERYPDVAQAVYTTSYMRDPGCFRYVVTRDGHDVGIDIINWNEGRHLQLMPPSTAILNLMPARPVQTNGFSMLVGELRQWTRHAGGIPQGCTNIAGRPAAGFLFESERPFAKTRATVWADLKTRLPVRVELFTKRTAKDPTDRMSEDRHSVLSDFKFNASLADMLFSVKPPEGYTVVTQDERVAIAPPLATEATLVEGLKLWAGLNNNTFPDELTNLELVHMLLRTDAKDQQNNKTLFAMYNVLTFVRQYYMIGRQWRYTGKGVKLNEKDRVIVEYQPAAGGLFHVIYADLSVREFPAGQLPAAPAPAVGTNQTNKAAM